MRAYIPNKYHVLDQDYRYIGSVRAHTSLEQAMQKAKELILSKRSLSCPHPVIVSDRKVAELGNAILSSPLSEADMPSAELQHSTGAEEHNRPKPKKHGGNIRKPVKGKPGAVPGKEARRQSVGRVAGK